MKRYLQAIALIVTLSSPVVFAGYVTQSCVHAPPTITTEAGKTAFAADQVIAHLSTVTDAILAANTAHRLSDSDSEPILKAIRAAVVTIKATPDGWRATASAGWTATKAALTPAQRDRLALYLGAIDILLGVL